MARSIPAMTEHKKTLLRLIHARADIGPLLREGLRYSQITQLLGEMIQDGLVLLREGVPTLTAEGVLALQTDERTGEPRADGGFIGALNSARIDKLAPDAVYLPVNRHSHF